MCRSVYNTRILAAEIFIGVHGNALKQPYLGKLIDIEGEQFPHALVGLKHTQNMTLEPACQTLAVLEHGLASYTPIPQPLTPIKYEMCVYTSYHAHAPAARVHTSS